MVAYVHWLYGVNKTHFKPHFYCISVIYFYSLQKKMPEMLLTRVAILNTSSQATTALLKRPGAFNQRRLLGDIESTQTHREATFAQLKEKLFQFLLKWLNSPRQVVALCPSSFWGNAAVELAIQCWAKENCMVIKNL